MNTALANGYLHFGITSQGYETTVRQPKAGWSTTSAAIFSPEWPVLSTSFSVDFLVDGAARTADILFISSATQADGTTTLTYQIKNSGATFLDFAADMPLEMSGQVPFAQKAVHLKANDGLIFKATFRGKPNPVPSTLVIYGGDRQVAAIETVGLYVTDGFKLDSNSSFLKEAWGSALKR